VKRALTVAAISTARAICAAVLMWLFAPATTWADETPPPAPALHLNQHYLEELNTPSGLDLGKRLDVFRFVFTSLDDEVRVYPTENYFYFSFFHNGLEIAGNIRLDALDRDDGIVHFAYFMKYNRWNEDLISEYRKLTRADGVEVERRAPLVYALRAFGREVVFRLHDSGLAFYLVYDRSLRLFHYILNIEVSAAEIYLKSRMSDDILIGQRTGFAVIEDRMRERRILIGIYGGNSLVNNYFDGPFDQLPDNFIEGDSFREILEHAFPDVRGEIDRFGNSNGGDSRLLVTPYIHYHNQAQLAEIASCAQAAGDDRGTYYRCFNTGQPQYSGTPD